LRCSSRSVGLNLLRNGSNESKEFAAKPARPAGRDIFKQTPLISLKVKSIFSSVILHGVGILDFIFPKFCINCKKLGSYVCDGCFSYLNFDTFGICVVCNRQAIGGITHKRCMTRYAIDGVFTGMEYKGAVKKLVYQFKYDPYISDLKNLLTDFLYESLIQKEEFVRAIEQLSNEAIVLVPIPLHPTRLRIRGYNQAEILAKELSKKLNISFVNVLQRVKNTRSQVTLKREERIKNIAGAFSIIPNLPDLPNTPNIFLVDDVLTTGATLNEAANVLKRNGAKKVWGIALARD